MNLKKRILIDLERTKYPNTGLFTFCNQLHKSLRKYSKKFEYTAYTKNKHAKNITVKSWHKLIGVPSSKFNVWHITYQNSSYTPLRNIPIVLTIHDLNFLYTNISEKKKAKLLKSVQRLIDKAVYVVVISEYVLKDVKKHCTIDKPIKVIYNGVDLLKFPDFELESKPQKKFVYTIGTVLPKKNFHALLPLLQKTEYDLIISGILPDNQYHNKILGLAKQLGVEDRVVLTGAISEEEKFWYMNNCEAFLFPSIMEGFGLPVIEAMQLGKPVFLSTYTCLPEIGGPHAYYFKDFKMESMYKTLIEGLQDYQQNNKSKSIIAWANKYTWQKAAEAYESVYQEVIDMKKINP